jgi:hypothetical protein
MLHAGLRLVKSMQCFMPAYGRFFSLSLVNKLVIFLQSCRARLLGKAAGQGWQEKLPGKLPDKATWQGCRARLLGKAAGQGWKEKLPGKLPGKATWQGYLARLPGN